MDAVKRTTGRSAPVPQQPPLPVTSFTSPQIVLLYVCWFFFIVAALTMHVVADVFQTDVLFPLGPTLSSAIALNAGAAFLSACIGSHTLEGFRLYQPFVGGQGFIVMQSVGYSFLFLSEAIGCAYVRSVQAPLYRFGVMSILGALAFAANATLLSSLLFFVTPQGLKLALSTTASSAPEQDGISASRKGGRKPRGVTFAPEGWDYVCQHLSRSPQREVVLVCAFAVVMVLSASCGLYGPREAAHMFAFVFVVFQALAGSLIHGVIGWKHTPGYQLFMPVLPSWGATIAQFFAWLLFSIALYWGVALSIAPCVDYTTAFLALGTAGVGSLVALLLTVLVVMRPHLQPLAGSSTLMLEYGPTMLTFASACHSIFIWGLGTSWSGATHLLLPTNDTASSSLYGINVAQLLAALFQVCIPAATHLLGHLTYGDAYEVWQPFRGSPGFVALQATGWTLFSTCWVVGATHFTAEGNHSLLLLSSIAFTTQILIHSSLYLFELPRCEISPSTSTSDLTSSAFRLRLRSMFAGKDQYPASTFVRAVLNGEMLLGICLLIAAMILCVVCDVGAQQLHDPGSGVEEPLPPGKIYVLRLVATILFFLAAPIIHVSARDKGIAMVRPFGGSGPYVALQAISWTSYAVLGMWTLASWMSQRSGVELMLRLLHDDLSSWSSADSTRQALQHMPIGWLSLEGLCYAMPSIIVAVSVCVETSATRERISDEDSLWETYRQLSHLLDEAVPNQGDRNRAEDLLEGIMEQVGRNHGSPSTSVLNPLVSTRRGSSRHLPGTRKEKQRAKMIQLHGTATLIVSMICISTAILFLSCAIAASKGSTASLCHGLAVSGLILTTICCFSAHYVYGTFVHGSSRYFLFQPFSGGTSFVALQATGWGFYTAAVVCVFLSCLRGFASPLVYVLAGGFSIASQSTVLASVPRFVVEHKSSLSWVEHHAEGVVSMLVFVASFFFTHAYQAIYPSSTVAGGGEALETVLDVPQMVPMVVSAVASCFAIPLAIVSIRRGLHHAKVEFEEVDAIDPDASWSAKEQKSRSIRNVIVTRVVPSVTFVAALLLCSFPFVGIFFVHYALRRSAAGAILFGHVWNATSLAVVGFLLLTVLLVSNTVFLRVLDVLRTLRVFLLFSIPTLVVVIPLGAPVVLPESIGCIMLGAHALWLTFLGDVRILRVFMVAVEVVVLGYTISSHLFVEWPGTLVCVLDALLPCFMIAYSGRFERHPEIHGTLQSQEWGDRMQRWFISACESYFHVRVLCDRPDAFRAMDAKFVFSFHPHGVFPVTALALPMMEAWRSAVPLPKNDLGFQKMSVHGASIIFRVPFLRDVAMMVGGRSVSRRALDTSLQSGNSVCIVTGGQAEMLLTCRSDVEMHLVTHHTGFVRLAVANGTSLVPIVCFAEHNVMANIRLPSLQKKMLQLIGFPFPTLPYGRWYLPVPHRTPLTIVVGEPLAVPEGLRADDKEGIEALTAEYFVQLKTLFYKHRAAAGYGNMELVLHSKTHRSKSK